MKELEELVVESPIAIRYRSLFSRLMGELKRAAANEPASAASIMLDLTLFDELLVDLVMRGLYSTVGHVEEQLRALEELLNDELEWTRQGHPLSTGPMFKYIGRKALEEAKARFDEGDHQAVMRAVAICASHDLIIPRWAADAFVAGHRKVDGGHVRSWDEAFGSAIPRGEKVTKRRKDKQLGDEILILASELHSDGLAFGPALFEKVSKKFGMGERQARELYYRRRRELAARMPLPGTLER